MKPTGIVEAVVWPGASPDVVAQDRDEGPDESQTHQQQEVDHLHEIPLQARGYRFGICVPEAAEV